MKIKKKKNIDQQRKGSKLITIGVKYSQRFYRKRTSFIKLITIFLFALTLVLKMTTLNEISSIKKDFETLNDDVEILKNDVEIIKKCNLSWNLSPRQCFRLQRGELSDDSGGGPTIINFSRAKPSFRFSNCDKMIILYEKDFQETNFDIELRVFG